MNNYNFWTDFIRYSTNMPALEFDNSVHISLQFKYMFVETPKVACSSIKLTLQKLELDDSDPGDARLNSLNVHNRNQSPLLRPSQVGDLDRFINREDIYKFCFVRNPYTRLLSAYLNKIKGNKPQKESILFLLGYKKSDLNIEISFDDFVNAIIDQPFLDMNAHWRAQFYQTCQDKIEYKFIGKFESFNEDFKHVLQKISIKSSAYLSEDKRHAQKANEHISHYYNKALCELVYDKFECDFDCFGYSKKLPEF